MSIDHFFDRPRINVRCATSLPQKPPLVPGEVKKPHQRINVKLVEQILTYLREHPEGRTCVQVALKLELKTERAQAYLARHALVKERRQTGMKNRWTSVWVAP